MKRRGDSSLSSDFFHFTHGDARSKVFRVVSAEETVTRAVDNLVGPAPSGCQLYKTTPTRVRRDPFSLGGHTYIDGCRPGFLDKSIVSVKILSRMDGKEPMSI